MRWIGKAVLSALLLAGAAPARADVAIGFSFGGDGGYLSDPCDYYDYYDAPPPWGMPADYCDYPVYSEPVYYGGTWYRGPIYYRWYGGNRLFWLNGGWRHDEWRGARPSIRWTDRGGWNRGRGDWNHSGYRSDWNRGSWSGNRTNWSGDRGNWNRGDRGSWSGNRDSWSGAGHNWSGGTRGEHNWSGHRGGWSGGGGDRGAHGGRH